ncbi:ALH_1b_G0047840.mRNA.1.CDS.1 [Saccharomyces cerevisiae]|nr:ALH_1b_G0047840.mRNA.1.CDS.1 [Saccharomyces cerevisiae]CAI6872001.1 ALH_1b_G0047840.mRNA.1.CDS.1 [Saccharomyces cerevisiae]
MSEGRSKGCIIKYGATCGIEDRGAAVLLNWDEKSARKNGRQKTIRSLWKRAREKLGFQRLRSMTSAGLQGPVQMSSCSLEHHRQLRSR